MITLHGDSISRSHGEILRLRAELEVCSKPPQQRGSSSGNMCNMAEESEEAEQAGSVEQAAAPAPKPARRHSHINKPSAPQRARRRLPTAPCAQIGKSIPQQTCSLFKHRDTAGVMSNIGPLCAQCFELSQDPEAGMQQACCHCC